MRRALSHITTMYDGLLEALPRLRTAHFGVLDKRCMSIGLDGQGQQLGS
jgi:hypothetical protein